MDTLYPLQLKPKLSPRLWGGKRLQTLLNIHDYDAAEPLGESWQVYADNTILNGPLAGQTLTDVAQAHGAALLGTQSMTRYGHKVPLLAKFIDAHQPLSIQVHPDDGYATTHEAHTGHLGKTEAWLVLEAEPGAKVLWGWQRDITAQEVRAAIEAGGLEHLTNAVPVSPGDVIFNPAGTLHAIGAGILIFEIQQSSDLTYRIYDYQRRGADGQLRELHVDKALEVLDLHGGNHAKIAPVTLSPSCTELIRCEAFVMERWRLDPEGSSQHTQPNSLEILTLIRGDATLTTASHAPLELTQGDALVLPAGLGKYQLTGEGVMVRCYVPVAP